MKIAESVDRIYRYIDYIFIFCIVSCASEYRRIKYDIMSWLNLATPNVVNRGLHSPLVILPAAGNSRQNPWNVAFPVRTATLYV